MNFMLVTLETLLEFSINPLAKYCKELQHYRTELNCDTHARGDSVEVSNMLTINLFSLIM